MRRRALLMGTTLVLAGMSTTAVAAKPGDLDTSFGNQGHADFRPTVAVSGVRASCVTRDFVPRSQGTWAPWTPARPDG